ncbi:3-hydroxyisobutyryl-CoA hydrolase, mitochondrial [Melia azedarach]|uniref:3-hydroxyisobutyryl-CoA hydrolase, mitochondrial n=1 Tax=Melia azedarach TaxID=155640 RepID=A0ACC1XNB2_MELAZ|nr:3-hydroxyisobutyryl-CoA hydrolase, mitochondrial [Melia azedarach]
MQSFKVLTRRCNFTRPQQFTTGTYRRSLSSLSNDPDNLGARMNKLYECWEKDSRVGFVVIKGNGRSFFAGEDVVNLYQGRE